MILCPSGYCLYVLIIFIIWIMDIIISSNNSEKIFTDKNVITIGTNPGCNFKLNLDYEVFFTIQYDFSLKNYVILNTFGNKNILFRSMPLKCLELGSINRLFFKNSNESLNIKLLNKIPA